MAIESEHITIRRCGTCGIFEPQKLGYLGKIVSHPCAHRNWQAVEYAPVKHVRGRAPVIAEDLDAFSQGEHP